MGGIGEDGLKPSFRETNYSDSAGWGMSADEDVGDM